MNQTENNQSMAHRQSNHQTAAEADHHPVAVDSVSSTEFLRLFWLDNPAGTYSKLSPNLNTQKLNFFILRRF